MSAILCVEIHIFINCSKPYFLRHHHNSNCTYFIQINCMYSPHTRARCMHTACIRTSYYTLNTIHFLNEREKKRRHTFYKYNTHFCSCSVCKTAYNQHSVDSLSGWSVCVYCRRCICDITNIGAPIWLIGVRMSRASLLSCGRLRNKCGI